MATAKAGFGTLLKRETTPSSGTYTTIGGITSLPTPGLTTDVVESTDMEAPSAMRTQVPTLTRLDPFTVTLNYDSTDATHTQLIADQVAKTVRNYQIVHTDGGADEWVFAAYVTGFQVTGERDGLTVASVTFTPTGAVTRS